jgi:formylglycine-generating enzyme required for sulfatase activity
MSNESFLNYSVDSDVINHYLRLLADENLKERNGNIALAKKLRLSEDALAALQQEFVILQQQLALIESNQPSFYEGIPEKKIGEDQYGRYAELVLQGVKQRFRFLPSGSFLMGSPESEAERDDDETQYRVTFQQGFWMADTACTQALWQAVMGDNPSNFTDNPENPVEQVSWDDVQIFLQRANDFVPEMVVRLPSEAEWEYACRAGTSSAFSFGNAITSNQANYDGNYVYVGDGREGEYREETLPVKSFSPNGWAFYQMHGNVWEWCQDTYDSYDNIPTDGGVVWLEGDSSRRVLRGGSWDDSPDMLRSACRGDGSPDFRANNVSFRVVISPPLADR